MLRFVVVWICFVLLHFCVPRSKVAELIRLYVDRACQKSNVLLPFVKLRSISLSLSLSCFCSICSLKRVCVCLYLCLYVYVSVVRRSSGDCSIIWHVPRQLLTNVKATDDDRNS